MCYRRPITSGVGWGVDVWMDGGRWCVGTGTIREPAGKPEAVNVTAETIQLSLLQQACPSSQVMSHNL